MYYCGNVCNEMTSHCCVGQSQLCFCGGRDREEDDYCYYYYYYNSQP